ncbi:RNA-directed DNA polymerase, eukaryota, reverse transcriptase zinc-binding domain protein [Tanacetum coccineum]
MIGLEDVYKVVAAMVPLRAPRGGAELSQFEALQAVIGDVVLTYQCDSWKWSLDVSAGFSVASVRHYVDDHTLEVGLAATRWNKCIPIKDNVFLWRMALNKLPSRVNLHRKGIDVRSVLCPICQDDVESVNHILFTCDMAKDLWDLLVKWWDLDIPVCANISEWYSWLDSLHVSIKAMLWDSIVSQSFLWISSRHPKLKFSWIELGVTITDD